MGFGSHANAAEEFHGPTRERTPVSLAVGNLPSRRPRFRIRSAGYRLSSQIDHLPSRADLSSPSSAPATEICAHTLPGSQPSEPWWATCRHERESATPEEYVHRFQLPVQSSVK